MTDELEALGEAAEEGALLPFEEMMKLFEKLTFREKVRRTLAGIKMPKDTGEYKWARLQVTRLLGPLCAVIVPCMALLLMALVAAFKPPPVRVIEIKILEPETVEELDEPEEIPEEIITPPDPTMDFAPDEAINMASDTVVPGPVADFSPKPAEFDSVAIVKSPVIMRGIYGSRAPGSRGTAIKRYGGNAATEGAVLRALRWLKKQQASDGSWSNHKSAMTGLGLLTFLAHGETPASEEFGPTVEKAIRWLVEHPNFPRRYEHSIATYALCEAYGLTKVPMIKYAAEKALDVIIKGQNAQGGWRYSLTPNDGNDISCQGWCAQALKAGKMAGLENQGLDEAMYKAIKGLKACASPSGGFGYTGPGRSGLTGVGVLCMQLLGASRDDDCRNGLQALEGATFNWDGKGVFNKNYYWYYITQAKFHAGGETWARWNKMFSPVLVKNQTIVKGGIMGPEGEKVDIGFWEMKHVSGHSDGVVMDTALAALQLQVYYRYLPTFKPPEEIAADEGAGEEQDIKINIKL